MCWKPTVTISAKDWKRFEALGVAPGARNRWTQGSHLQVPDLAEVTHSVPFHRTISAIFSIVGGPLSTQVEVRCLCPLVGNESKPCQRDDGSDSTMPRGALSPLFFVGMVFGPLKGVDCRYRSSWCCIGVMDPMPRIRSARSPGCGAHRVSDSRNRHSRRCVSGRRSEKNVTHWVTEQGSADASEKTAIRAGRRATRWVTPPRAGLGAGARRLRRQHDLPHLLSTAVESPKYHAEKQRG
jgi:hypothetical protein